MGKTLGSLLEPGDAVLLQGDLGAGKTCFSQGVARGLGVPEDEAVTSPTYTLLNLHQGRAPLLHADLYRLGDAEELEDIGFDDYQDGHHVLLVEWVDRFPELFEEGLWTVIDYGHEENTRNFTFEARGSKALSLLTRLRQALATEGERR